MKQLVAVVGSANLDVIATASRRPEPGETILGTSYTEAPGGKGANQAIAAVGVGPTAMVGCIGTDAGGTLLVEALAAAGVDTQKLERSDIPTGRAIVLLTQSR